MREPLLALVESGIGQPAVEDDVEGEMCERKTVLAECQGFGSVRLCECGSVNLNIGAVTLHLDERAMLQAAAMLREAIERYAVTKSDRQLHTSKLPDLSSLLVN